MHARIKLFVKVDYDEFQIPATFREEDKTTRKVEKLEVKLSDGRKES
jgi:hypothetical protein